MSMRDVRLRLGLQVAMVAAAACAALALAPGARADTSSTAATETHSDLAGGAEIYANICQGCHMPGGQGAIGAGFYPKLAGDPTLVSWQYAAIVVLGGKHGMPPFGLPANQVAELTTTHLSDEQIADVVNYVRTSFGNKFKDKATAAAVAQLPHPGHAADVTTGTAPRK
jgi:mono/diheme cytochrome c family protein